MASDWLSDLRMRPITLLAAGLVLVAVDFRTRAVDYLPDVVGWLLVGVAASLYRVEGAPLLAVVAAVLSISELALPYMIVRIDPVTGGVVPPGSAGSANLPFHQQWDELPIGQGVLMASATIIGGVGVSLLLGHLATRAELAQRDAIPGRLHIAHRALPILLAGPITIAVMLAAVRGQDYDPVWNDSAGVPALLAVALILLIAVGLALSRNKTWARVERAA